MEALVELECENCFISNSENLRLQSGSEVSCIDKSSKPRYGFYKVFQVYDVLGEAVVDINYIPNPESPSNFLKNNEAHPTAGLVSVYRTVVKTIHHGPDVADCGSALRVTGPINNGREFLLLTCAHCLPYTSVDEVIVSNIARGALVNNMVTARKGSKFTRVAASGADDLACIRSEEPHCGSWETCFLPARESLQRGKPVCTYSFPAAGAFLKKAHEELVLGMHKKGSSSSIWEDYSKLHVRLLKDSCGSETKAKEELYDMLQDTWGHVVGLVASPGIIQSPDVVNPMEILNSTLPGSSGGPVLSFSGAFEFIGMHQSGNKGTNFVISCDNIGFVRFYAAHVLPHLPPLTSKAWGTRDLTAFRNWLTYHNLP